MRLNWAVLQIRLQNLPFPLEVMHNPFFLAHIIEIGTKSMSHCSVLMQQLWRLHMKKKLLREAITNIQSIGQLDKMNYINVKFWVNEFVSIHYIGLLVSFKLSSFVFAKKDL